MKIPIYRVDAFTDQIFQGNPAAVCPLEYWLPDMLMQKIAFENNLSETAFFVQNELNFELRWFTPTNEVNLCGHATLASAHTLYTHLNYEYPIINFYTKSGLLKVEKKEDGQYEMAFPADSPIRLKPTDLHLGFFGIEPLEVIQGKEDLLLVFKNEAEIKSLVPNLQAMKSTTTRVFIASALSKNGYIASRCFAPGVGVDEDPVTGSAQTLLAPYWAAKLNNYAFISKQLSARQGTMVCQVKDDLVYIKGQAVTTLIGDVII